MAKKTKPVKSKSAPKAKASKPAAKKAVKKAPKKVAAPKKAAKKPAPKAKPAKKAPVKKPVVAKTKGKASKPEKVKASPKGAKPAEKEKLKAKAAPAPEPEEIEVAAELGTDEDAEVILTDAEGRRYCRVKDCDQLSAVDGYCRYHYLLFWKKIQVRKKILTEGKLERYVEELTARYPDKFLDVLRKDLRSDKDFLAAIQELEIDETAGDNEFEEEAQTYIDEVRGMSEPAAREEEDF
jgi:hypothetical protein